MGGVGLTGKNTVEEHLVGKVLYGHTGRKRDRASIGRPMADTAQETGQEEGGRVKRHASEPKMDNSDNRHRKQALKVRLENCQAVPESEVVTLKTPTRLYSKFYKCLGKEGWSRYITTPKY